VGEVIDYYFEFSDHILSMKLAPSKYCTYRGQNLDRVREYVWNADRIWADSRGRVFYVKHKTADLPRDKVDEKEFMWIKLSAQDIK
jgi:hypothetical protein